jgi:lipopolysaccharide transport system ATP-binding protein
MADIAIRAERIAKQYRLGTRAQKFRTLRESLVYTFRRPLHRVRGMLRGEAPAENNRETIWALRDVSFEIRQGEVVGIIGHNGAGKSTLLKILTRITEPTSGYADVYGRVGSLLEVGTGFHPELTGRENIFLSGSILGMRRHEITRKFDDIVAFAEVEKFIDTAVKHYSSGMYLRLAFAVAAYLEPEILLVDEVLAVGDASFQRRCLGKMGEVAHRGRTVLFVSHNLAAITNLTQRTLLLSKGSVAFDGATEDAVRAYLTSREEDSTTLLNAARHRLDGLSLKRLTLRRSDGEVCGTVQTGDPLVIELEYEAHEPQLLEVSFGFTNTLGVRVTTLSSRNESGELLRVEGNGVIRCLIPALMLTQDRYFVRLRIRANRVTIYDTDQAATLNVMGGDVYGTGNLSRSQDGVYVQRSNWELVQPETRALNGFTAQIQEL